MIPDKDLWHSVFYEQDGYVAVLDLTGPFPSCNVYTPDGEWCGCSGASNHLSRLADVRHIIRWNKLCKNKKVMSKKPTREEIEIKVNDIIVDKLGLDPSEVKADAVLATEFQADSLDAVEICIELEKEFGISIEDDAFNTVHQMKVSDVYDLVGERV